jgi:hypothetical protein
MCMNRRELAELNQKNIKDMTENDITKLVNEMEPPLIPTQKPSYPKKHVCIPEFNAEELLKRIDAKIIELGDASDSMT